KASYAELIGGRYFNVPLEWNKEMGNTLYAPGKAKPKDPKDYKIVGKPLPREDIAPLVYCEKDYCTDVKRPGMLHARMIRPPVAGATPVKVDEASIKDIGGAKVYQEKGFLAVYAENEWDAIKASQKLKVEWSDVKPPFVEQATLYDHIRKAPARKRGDEGKQAGNVDEALRNNARAPRSTLEAMSPPTSSRARASRAWTSTPTAASRSIRSPAISAASSSSRATTSASRQSRMSSPTSGPTGRRSRRCSTAPLRC